MFSLEKALELVNTTKLSLKYSDDDCLNELEKYILTGIAEQAARNKGNKKVFDIMKKWIDQTIKDYKFRPHIHGFFQVGEKWCFCDGVSGVELDDNMGLPVVAENGVNLSKFINDVMREKTTVVQIDPVKVKTRIAQATAEQKAADKKWKENREKEDCPLVLSWVGKVGVLRVNVRNLDMVLSVVGDCTAHVPNDKTKPLILIGEHCRGIVLPCKYDEESDPCDYSLEKDDDLSFMN